MGHFYKPHWMFGIGLSILSFPAIAFRFHKMHSAWQKWYRRWTRSRYRTGGWLLMRRWSAAFKRDGFLDKLAEAKKRLQTE